MTARILAALAVAATLLVAPTAANAACRKGAGCGHGGQLTPTVDAPVSIDWLALRLFAIPTPRWADRYRHW